MKFCQTHWDMLRASVESRGMGHLVAANGRDALARTVADLEGRAEPDDFDPLMGAHNVILSRALDAVGLGLMFGDLCPVCEVLPNWPPIPEGHRYATNESYWIDGPVDAMREIAQQRGLV